MIHLSRKFKILKLTARGNLLLESAEKAPVTGKLPFRWSEQKAGFIFETIGRMESPLYLGKAEGISSEKLVGKTVETG